MPRPPFYGFSQPRGQQTGDHGSDSPLSPAFPGDAEEARFGWVVCTLFFSGASQGSGHPCVEFFKRLYPRE